VAFDFAHAAETDFHVIKALLQRYLDGAELDSSQLADALICEVRILEALRSQRSAIGLWHAAMARTSRCRVRTSEGTLPPPRPPARRS
jgi:BCCIP